MTNPCRCHLLAIFCLAVGQMAMPVVEGKALVHHRSFSGQEEESQKPRKGFHANLALFEEKGEEGPALKVLLNSGHAADVKTATDSVATSEAGSGGDVPHAATTAEHPAETMYVPPSPPQPGVPTRPAKLPPLASHAGGGQRPSSESDRRGHRSRPSSRPPFSAAHLMDRHRLRNKTTRQPPPTSGRKRRKTFFAPYEIALGLKPTHLTLRSDGDHQDFSIALRSQEAIAYDIGTYCRYILSDSSATTCPESDIQNGCFSRLLRIETDNENDDFVSRCLCPRNEEQCTNANSGDLDSTDENKRPPTERCHYDAEHGVCISFAEAFHAKLQYLLSRRGKKDLALKIRFSSAPARVDLPYGPYGPQIIGHGQKGLDVHEKYPDWEGGHLEQLGMASNLRFLSASQGYHGGRHVRNVSPAQNYWPHQAAPHNYHSYLPQPPVCPYAQAYHSGPPSTAAHGAGSEYHQVRHGLPSNYDSGHQYSAQSGSAYSGLEYMTEHSAQPKLANRYQYDVPQQSPQRLPPPPYSKKPYAAEDYGEATDGDFTWVCDEWEDEGSQAGHYGGPPVDGDGFSGGGDGGGNDDGFLPTLPQPLLTNEHLSVVDGV